MNKVFEEYGCKNSENYLVHTDDGVCTVYTHPKTKTMNEMRRDMSVEYLLSARNELKETNKKLNDYLYHNSFPFLYRLLDLFNIIKFNYKQPIPEIFQKTVTDARMVYNTENERCFLVDVEKEYIIVEWKSS